MIRRTSARPCTFAPRASTRSRPSANVEHGVPVVVRHLEREVVPQPRVVDEDVDPTETLLDLWRTRPEPVRLRDVARYRDPLRPCGLDGLDGLPASLLREIKDGNVGPSCAILIASCGTYTSYRHLLRSLPDYRAYPYFHLFLTLGLYRVNILATKGDYIKMNLCAIGTGGTYVKLRHEARFRAVLGGVDERRASPKALGGPPF